MHGASTLSKQEKVKPEKTVGALVAGLKVIRYLINSKEPVGVSKVAKELSISPSTCFSLLRTLVHEDLLSFNTTNKTYAVSFGLLELLKGAMEEGQHSLKLIKEKMRVVAADHGVTTMLFRRLGSDRVVLVERADANTAVRVHIPIGQRLPMYIGALGRCFAAYGHIDRDLLHEKFKELRWESAPSFSEFWRDVKNVEQQGYAVDRDHFTRGITVAAAPILDSENFPVMVVSAVGFSGQFDDRALELLGNDIRKCTQEASAWF